MADSQANTHRETREWLLLVECASARPDPAKFLTLERACRFEHLLQLAEAHGVIHLLASRLREADGISAPREFRQRLLELERAQLLSGLALIAEMIRVLERFAAAGIQTLVLKGPALSLQAYGDATARQFADIDLLVRHGDVLRATKVMMEAGFAPAVGPEVVAAGKVPGEYSFSRPGSTVIVEVHTERTLRYFPNRLAVEEVFLRSARLDFDGRAVPALSLEDALVSMCTHGAKHFWERLMWIADVAATLARRPEVDWEAARTIAKKLDAQRMLHSGLLLARDLLKAPLPAGVERDARADRGARALARKIQNWLPAAEGTSAGLVGRALFRAQMRSGFWAGIGYLTRLSLSPTEDDWEQGQEHKPSRYRDMSRRLWRLLGKYGRDPNQ